MGKKRILSKDEPEAALAHWAKLEEVRNNAKVCDRYIVDDLRCVVTSIYKHFVVTVNEVGKRECFIWDDVNKIINGCYVREGRNIC